jgi:hypothetical protein
LNSTNARAVLACLNRRGLYRKVFLVERIPPQAEWQANTGMNPTRFAIAPRAGYAER